MKLLDMLIHCKETVPYYQQLFAEFALDLDNGKLSEEFMKLPLLKKEFIASDIDKILSNKYDKEKLLSECTSGSTGKPLIIYRSYNDKILSGREIWKFREKEYGVTPRDIFCMFHMATMNENKEAIAQRVIYFNNGLSFSLLHLNPEDIKLYYELLKEHKVKWIFGAPSAILHIARYIQINKLEPLEDLKYVEVSGEFQTLAAKKEIEKGLNCKVADLYGLKEVYGVACSCAEGNLHIFDENVYVEVIDDEGGMVGDNEEGNLIITSLNNSAMPFIRYETGDKCIVKHNFKCSCGREGKIISLSSGRVADYVEIDENKKISSCVFYLAVSETNIVLDSTILQFQVIQSNKKDFILKIVLSNDAIEHDVIEKLYLKYLNKFGMPNVNWEFEYVDYFEQQKNTGKHKYYICNM